MADQAHAIRVSQNGGPEVLEWTSVDVPKPGPDQLLVRLTAAGVNFIDVYHRDGLYPLDLPFTPGVEGAGTVEAAGADVTDLEPGARVAWAGPLGSYAEYALVPAQRAVTVPRDVDLDLAAALMLQGMTAHYLAFGTFPLGEGDRCLVHAGAGGVGHLLIQIAKMRGATVFTTVSSEEKAELARRVGADHVIEYTEQDFVEAVRGIAGDNALDVVYDGVGADTVLKGLELLRRRGMMVAYGNASGPPPEIDPLQHLMSRGSLFLTRPSLFDYVSTREELEQRAGDLFRWVADGNLKVHVGARLPLGDAAEAHRLLEGRRTTGKVLLEA
jgi:NADPH2:quinone reductase